MRSLGLSVIIISGIAIYQKIVGQGMVSLEAWPNQLVKRATSIFPDPNFLGLYLGPLIVLAIGQLIRQFKNVSKFRYLLIIYWFLISLVSILAVIFARCEGSLVGVIAGLIFIGIIWRSSRRWVVVGLAILVIFILTIAPIRSFIFQKATLQDLSGQVRLRVWLETTTMLKEHPFLGAGLTGYRLVMEKYHQPIFSKELPLNLEIQPYPHNIFLAVWAELGLPGLLVFFLIIIQFFRQGSKKFSFFSLLIMGVMVCILVHGLVDTPYFKNDLSVIFWLFIGMMLLEKRRGAGVVERAALEKR